MASMLLKKLSYALAGILLVACSPDAAKNDAGGPSASLEGRLSITGSSTLAPLVSEIAKRFETLHPQVRIDVQTGGSGKGIADTRYGVADIGMASRSLKPEESELTEHLIAIDGVALIVNQANPIQSLSTQQVVDIYTGQIRSWQSLGGADQGITVVHKAEGRATLEVFLQHFKIDNPSVRADVIVGDNEHGIKTVIGAPAAIGYVSIGSAEAAIEADAPLRLLPLDGVDASSASVAQGTYPLSRSLNLVTQPNPPALAAAFVRFCQSPAVADLLRANYFVAPASPHHAAQ